ncbi:MAG: hypothetical protein GF414_04410 [Candidatus Altiarchaeales archaeon]|nr:hypothetical protein [Candidatus Altiarchaeales archaeon]
MRSKILDENTLSDELVSQVKKLVRRIKRRHTLVQVVSDELSKDKASLVTIGKEQFFKDLEAEVPEIYGNHDMHTDSGTVRINYKVKTSPKTEINGQPAAAYLKGEFGSYYDKLFKESEAKTLTADEAELKAQAKLTPELFGIQLKAGLTPAQLMQLVQACPDALELSVPDIEKYAQVYPADVETTTSVKPANGFLDNLADIPASLVKQAKDYLVELLKQDMSPAVVCGNASQKKPKK